MNSSSTIIGVGSPIIDTVVQVEDNFIDQIDVEKGGMQLVDKETYTSVLKTIPAKPVRTPGGSAGNTTFALARMGNLTRFLGKTGNCDEGEFFRSEFLRLGGSTQSFKVGNTINGQCLSMVTPDGERTFLTHLGASMTLDSDEISVEDFTDCTHAHIEGYLVFNRSLITHILKCAKSAGCSVSLDLASFDVVQQNADFLSELLNDYVDIVFANEKEAAVFTGLPETDYDEMSKQLSKYCEIAVVKAGAMGSYLTEQNQTFKVEAVPVSQVVDTTGAGDLWAAGFLHGWSRGQSLTRSADIGSVLGAAVVQVPGSVLPQESWERSLSEIGTILSS